MLVKSLLTAQGTLWKRSVCKIVRVNHNHEGWRVGGRQQEDPGAGPGKSEFLTPSSVLEMYILPIIPIVGAVLWT